MSDGLAYMTEFITRVRKALGDDEIKSGELYSALSRMNVNHVYVDGKNTHKYSWSDINAVLGEPRYRSILAKNIAEVRYMSRIANTKPLPQPKPAKPKISAAEQRRVDMENWIDAQHEKARLAREAERAEAAANIRDNGWHEMDMEYLSDHYFDNEIDESYTQWHQTEPTTLEQAKALIGSLTRRLDRIESLTPEEVWTAVRDLAYLNHGAFKACNVPKGERPTEMLSDDDKSLNDAIYEYKVVALGMIRDYYMKHRLPVSTNVDASDPDVDMRYAIIAFRDPMTGVRQITFHVGNNPDLLGIVPDKTAEWDGVKQAHRYADDDSYYKARYGMQQ